MNRILRFQGERSDFDIELLATLAGHAIGAAHRTGRRLEAAPRRVLEGLPGCEHRLWPTTPGPLTSSVWSSMSVMIQCRLRSCTVSAPWFVIRTGVGEHPFVLLRA